MAWTNTNPTEAILESDEHYWQPYGMHSYTMSNGISEWVNYEWVTFRIREKVTRYAGVKSNTAISGLTDVLEVSPLKADGTEVFEHHSVRWRRGRANPCGGYDVIKTEKWTALYVNGSYVRGATVAQVTATN